MARSRKPSVVTRWQRNLWLLHCGAPLAAACKDEQFMIRQTSTTSNVHNVYYGVLQRPRPTQEDKNPFEALHLRHIFAGDNIPKNVVVRCYGRATCTLNWARPSRYGKPTVMECLREPEAFPDAPDRSGYWPRANKKMHAASLLYQIYCPQYI